MIGLFLPAKFKLSLSQLRRTGLAVAFASIASVSFADALQISGNTYSNGSNGGSYTINPLSGPITNLNYSSLAILAPGTFESFCLEPTEYFVSGSTYNYTVASYAFGGGVEDVSRNIGPGDQLSVGTAWLYSQFATGTLGGFDYSAAGRKNSNLLLQQAFWYLEDDRATGSVFSNAAISFFGSVSAAKANASVGQYGVYALNLTSGTNNQVNNQSQLYYHVPEGSSTALMLGLAFLGCAAFRRKKSAA
jgi:hypothetical protein